MPAEKPTDPDGYRRALQDVQDELRSLRADIANLASTLAQAPPLTTPAAPSAPTLAATTPSPDLVPTASGMLQQHDPLSPGVQTRRFQARQVQQGVTPQQVAAAQDERINEQRLTVRQQELLRALQRAEQRLQDAPQDAVPPGLKDQVIGEILRAKYNVALFGGLGGAALTGWLTSAVA